ncbi:alpha/beta hydrolase family protein [Sorangium sp. So ce233]|uniref:alpha/beta hydrolase family protein n=1 Tax=Sorangium sp. So ce233 TaxID=3133290 RepID=UPI003F5F70C2
MDACSEEVRVPAAQAVLAGTLLAPTGAGRRPCLLLVSGSGANDRDETVCGHTPFRVIAEYFAARGHVVLRCDDRGVGGSSGDAGEQDFAGSVADVVTTCRWLASHPAVDAERIALLGHSEGGLIAAAAAPQTEASAVVMLAGPAVPIEWLLHEQARTLSAEAGATPAQIEHERRMNEQVFALARSSRASAAVRSEIERVIREYLRSWPDLPAVDEAAVDENARVMAGVVGAPAYRSLLRQKPAEILGRLDRRLLAVYGGKDVQVPGAANADACRRITAGHRHATVRLFPGHNHLFQQAGTGSISEYEVLPPGPDTEVLREVADWLSAADRSDRAASCAAQG